MPISVTEFCKMVEIVNNRYGMDVMVSEVDNKSLMHLTQQGKEIGRIDVDAETLYLIASDETIKVKD